MVVITVIIVVVVAAIIIIILKIVFHLGCFEDSIRIIRVIIIIINNHTHRYRMCGPNYFLVMGIVNHLIPMVMVMMNMRIFFRNGMYHRMMRLMVEVAVVAMVTMLP